MIRREETRLKTVFQRLLLLTLAAPAGVYACSSASSGGGGETTTTPDGGGSDATFGHDSAVAPGTDGAVPPGTDGGTAADGGPSSCVDTHGDPYFTDASWVDTEAGPRQCYYFVDFPCGADYDQSKCYLYLKDCPKICNLDGGPTYFDCHYWEGAGCADASYTGQPGKPTTIACGLCSGVGRRPAGLADAAPACAETPLGEWFARAAHLEAASVDAFHALRAELELHGAPRALLRMAERSAKDEVRHARVTTRIAKRFGATPATPRVKRRAPRALAAIARENAVEGCVRETFGAMVATWQAAHAKDTEIAAAMRDIAHDETRHAALAWAVARWADAKLDARERAAVARARRRAVAKLADEIAKTDETAIAETAGLPDRAQARALLAEMKRALWS